MVNRFISRFLRETQGQDLIEYTLLLAALALGTLALAASAFPSMSGVWIGANATLAQANAAAKVADPSRPTSIPTKKTGESGSKSHGGGPPDQNGFPGTDMAIAAVVAFAAWLLWLKPIFWDG